MPANDCYLLGAGFSRAISTGKMPTLKELGDAVLRDLNLSDGVLRPFGDNLEEWMSYLSIDQPWLSDQDNLRNRAKFGDASQAVGRCIRASETETIQTSIPTSLERLILKWCETESSVMSFNYDTLIERGGYELRRLHHWGDMYSLPITERTGANHGLVLGYSRPDVKLLELFKLHGSTNWAFSGLEAPPSDPIVLMEPTGRWATRNPSNSSDRGPAASLHSDLIPLIVPPTGTKSAFYANRALRAQWRKATERLQQATSLTIIGYSFPLTDLGTKHFIATSLPEGVPVTVIDQNPDVGHSVKDLLGKKTEVKSYAGENAVAEYIDETCGDIVRWGTKRNEYGKSTPFVLINGIACPNLGEALGDGEYDSGSEAERAAADAVERKYPGVSASGSQAWAEDSTTSKLALSSS